MTHFPQTQCPDWSSLFDHRDQERYEDAWGRAMEHLDECESCRENAFAFEPTLMFQDLPDLEVGHDEIDDMKQAVAAMRRAQSFEEQTVSRPFSFRLALRAAAVAGIGLAMLLLQGAFDLPMPSSVDSQQASIVTGESQVAELWPAEPLTIEPSPVVDQQHSLVEELEPLAGTVIQLVDSEIDMVVFYSDNLDV